MSTTPDNGKPAAREDDGNICEITIKGTTSIGEYPRIPTRFVLQRSLQDALGYDEFDRKALAERKDGEPVPGPSQKADSFAITQTFYAAVGLCWGGNPGWPTFRKCRHDPVVYGEGVYDWFYRNQYHASLATNLTDEGRRLLHEMVRKAANELVQEIAAEKDFSPASGEVSTGA